jgi:hypothetical protein
MSNFTTYLGRDTRLPPIPRYRDPITGRIDGNAINREFDYRDFHTSYFLAKPAVTTIQLQRLVNESASPNDRAWAQAWLNLGVPASGVLESQNPGYKGPQGPVGF